MSLPSKRQPCVVNTPGSHVLMGHNFLTPFSVLGLWFESLCVHCAWVLLFWMLLLLGVIHNL